jgi:hypothetical protein
MPSLDQPSSLEETLAGMPRETHDFRRELYGTAWIAAALAAILGLGWLGTTLVGRTTVTPGPGVELHRGAGWGESWIGPRGHWSSRWPIGASVLIVAPHWDEGGLDEVLADYRLEVIADRDADAVFEPPESTAHPAGDARIQHWSTIDANGDPVVGELVAVINGATCVVLDARWPESESAAVIAEIRRVVASLVIEPLGP